MQQRRNNMLRFGRLLSLLLLVGVTPLTFAQGSAGGYGQGGQGAPGGFGGGGMGGGRGAPAEINRSKDDKNARPDDEQQDEIWETKTAILTPGDRVEYKLKMKKGETVFAAATSDAFDPALSIEDDQKHELKKNDDRSDGDQSPFLIFRVPAEGTYTLKVLSYRAVSGGKFTLKMRTFIANDAPLGKTRHEKPTYQDLRNSYDRVVFRLQGKKGAVYDLRTVRAIQPRGSYPIGFLRIVGPTGVEAEDFERIGVANGVPVFKAKQDGDFYCEYQGGDQTYETEFSPVETIAASSTFEKTFDLQPGELKVVEFPVKPDLIVRTIIGGGSLLTQVSAPSKVGADIGGTDGRSYGNAANWLWFRMNCDSDDDVVRVYHGEGTARVAIRAIASSPRKVTFKNTEGLPTWTPGADVKDSLEIGDSRLFLIKLSNTELKRVQASASHFQTRLDIFTLAGDLANSLCDRTKHKSADDLYFPEEGTFIVRLSCDGHGGSGEFVMARDLLTPAPYTLGAAQVLKLDGINFGLYSVNLEAGKRYVLMTDQPGNPLRADLLDDDGQFLISQRIQFDKVEVQYFVPTRSGRHRLWLRGAPGERHFKFELHTPPSIGGS